jgi:hypothetical protein
LNDILINDVTIHANPIALLDFEKQREDEEELSNLKTVEEQALTNSKEV